MATANVKFQPEAHICACPKCGNKTDFKLISDRGGEDFCDVFLQCVCGETPSSSCFIEDTWGELSKEMASACADQWNEWVESLNITSDAAEKAIAN